MMAVLKRILLVVDVGGTKTELALFDLYRQTLEPVKRAITQCAAHSSIAEIISAFLHDNGIQPDFACLGVAGVVENGMARITNLPWQITEDVLAGEFSLAGVKLINDMTALCAAIPILNATDLLTLQEGKIEKDGTKAVIAPGTGLGEGYLVETETAFLPRGSEGGHSNFAPVDDEQIHLLQWLGRKVQPVSYEMLCSGLGIPTLYDFFRECGRIPETDAIREQLREATDRTPVILNGAISATPCPLCRKSLELFLSILGSESGNLALKLYATGGLYIGGGILPRLVGKISFIAFMEAFCRKAKMENLLARIPVRLILKRDAVLFGTAEYGRHFFLSAGSRKEVHG
jgi:glucokinase